MANDGQIVFEVTADGKHAIADIKEITRAIQQETGKWDDAAEEATDNIGNSFSGMLKKIATGFSLVKIGKALLDFGKDAVQAASDLSEVQNVVDTTFGASGAAKIEAWAKRAGTAFGLSETQAKRFTSTLGAMMKSSGMAGDEIVGMSTDLAGLAADMASFYNLDFDTAFQKIRSGISGETEPLKQLGINMSVANLQAFALQQGLTKTFAEMSQGEQTMLRYQYLMSATADAQGDFARTSDGYANGMRALETQLETLKTNLGSNILPVIEWAVGEINGLFGGGEEETWSRRRTVLDDIADIDVKTQAAIENINSTKKVVDELTQNLEEIGQKKGTLEDATGNITTAVNGVSKLASELGKVKIEGNAKEAFESTLTILYNNVDALSKIKGTDAQGVKDWLDGVATEAKKLNPEDASAWATLMTSLFSEIPGFEGTEDGKSLIEQLTQYYLSLGSESEEAAKGLAALGYGTEDIDAKQKDWLSTCKELVHTMPGLADIIDTNTGEVKGGIPAIKAYADEWERTAKYQAQIQGIKEKKALYEGLPEQSELASDVRTKKATARAYLMGYGKMSAEEADAALAGAELMAKTAYNGGGIEGQKIDDYGFVNYDSLRQNASHAYGFFYGGEMWNGGVDVSGANSEGVRKMDNALADYMESLYAYDEYIDIQPEMQAAYDDALQETAEAFGMTTEAVEADADALAEAERNMSKVQKAANGDEQALQDVTDAVNAANEALKAMADHAQTVYDNTVQAINNVASSLDRVDYQSYGKQIEKISELTQKQAKYKVGSEEWKKLQTEIDKANESLVSTANIKKNLQSQATFLDEYLANLKKAREMGLSNELLANLSDGSVESAEYLSALVNGGVEEAKEIDAMYTEIQGKKAELAQELTGQQLTVDQTYQSLAAKAKEAVSALDMENEAADNTGKTVQGIATGISQKIPAVEEAVNGIIEQLNRLDGWGINIDLGGFGSINIKTTAGKTEGSGRMGIPLVPHDDYIARLHEGERVLTAQENQIWNALRNGGVAGFDLETLGGVMRDNVKAGGNVYLDGRVVGSVISDQQGKSYRQLQRSGWQG